MSLQKQIKNTTPIYNNYFCWSFIWETARDCKRIVLGKILKKEGLNKEVRNITEWGGVERFSCMYHNKVLYCLVRLKNPFHINSDAELFYWKQLLGNFYFINQNHASYIQYAYNKVIVGSAC